MDDASKIETFKSGLRIKYSSDVVGLRKYVLDLVNNAASDEVVITQQNFSDGGSSGQLVLEPMAKLEAAMQLLRELDPASAPQSPDYAYARFSAGTLSSLR